MKTAGGVICALLIALYLLGLTAFALHLSRETSGPLHCAAIPSYGPSPVHCVDSRTGARSTFNPA